MVAVTIEIQDQEPIQSLRNFLLLQRRINFETSVLERILLHEEAVSLIEACVSLPLESYL